MASYEEGINAARGYYNSRDTSNFYLNVWGGEDIHIGVYKCPNESIFDASRRTVDRMAAKVQLGQDKSLLDLGAGYGGAARHLARTYGCHVTAINLIEEQNERNRRLNSEQGLSHLVEVVDAAFEDIPYPDDSFDVIWSQDAMLHSSDKTRVLEEAVRLLKPGGDFIFTDPMVADECPASVLDPILERAHLESMASPGFYRSEIGRMGLEETDFEDHSSQVATHYTRVRQELERREEEFSAHISHPPSREQVISSALDSEEAEDVLPLPGKPVNQSAPGAGSQQMHRLK